MKLLLLRLLTVCFFISVQITFLSTAFASDRHFIIITDLEHDDRLALHLLAAEYDSKEILFVGTVGKHAGVKKALARKLLDQIGLTQVPVYQGTGMERDAFPAVNSLEAAKTYEEEGKGILDDGILNSLRARPFSSDELQIQLQSALKAQSDLEILVLAQPTDLVAVLAKEPELKSRIQHIFVMGGWTESTQNSIFYSSYNWNLDIEASAKLMQMSDVPMTLFSSHMIKPTFDSGAIHPGNFPGFFEVMDSLKPFMPSLIDREKASIAWGQHVKTKIKSLPETVKKYLDQGKQVNASDLVLSLSVVNSQLIEATRAVSIEIQTHPDQTQNGFPVVVRDYSPSKIVSVEKINTKLFLAESLRLFDRLSSKLSQKN